jgi:hypothetical protein
LCGRLIGDRFPYRGCGRSGPEATFSIAPSSSSRRPFGRLAHLSGLSSGRRSEGRAPALAPNGQRPLLPRHPAPLPGDEVQKYHESGSGRVSGSGSDGSPQISVLGRRVSRADGFGMADQGDNLLNRPTGGPAGRGLLPRVRPGPQGGIKEPALLSERAGK